MCGCAGALGWCVRVCRNVQKQETGLPLSALQQMLAQAMPLGLGSFDKTVAEEAPVVMVWVPWGQPLQPPVARKQGKTQHEEQDPTKTSKQASQQTGK